HQGFGNVIGFALQLVGQYTPHVIWAIVIGQGLVCPQAVVQLGRYIDGACCKAWDNCPGCGGGADCPPCRVWNVGGDHVNIIDECVTCSNVLHPSILGEQAVVGDEIFQCPNFVTKSFQFRTFLAIIKPNCLIVAGIAQNIFHGVFHVWQQFDDVLSCCFGLW